MVICKMTMRLVRLLCLAMRTTVAYGDRGTPCVGPHSFGSAGSSVV